MNFKKNLFLSLFFSITFCIQSGQVPESVLMDWDRQERVNGRITGTPSAIADVLTRGRALAGEMVLLGEREKAGRCLETLNQVECEVKKINPLRDGPWHLVRATVCGGAPDLDSGRVRGKSYHYHPPLKNRAGEVSPVQTVSTDADRVIYRFSGLNPQADYRLRAVYGSDFKRSLCLSVDGIPLQKVIVPNGTIEGYCSRIPQKAVSDGTVEIVVDKITGANAIISALEIWSTSPETGKSQPDILLACRNLIMTCFCEHENIYSDLYCRARQAVRELMFSHPALNFGELLFVKRSWPIFYHQSAHRVGESQIPGAALCVLKGLRPDGELRTIFSDPKGGIGRPDLSFDGKRILFPYALPRIPQTRYIGGDHRSYSPLDPVDRKGVYRGGSCHMYDVYEINVDGTGLRNLTQSIDTEDTEPCYLPDGRIVFTSNRDGRVVQCGDWALVFGLYTMNADGSGVRAFTQPQDSEFYPSVLSDGRILFTRWDYIMKAYNVIQQLWVTNPDGTKTQLAYGDWYSFSWGPLALQEARQIPGTSKVIAVGAAHHNTGAGPLMLVDLKQNRGGPGGMRNITPEVGYPEAWTSRCIRRNITDERSVKSEPEILPINNTRNTTGWYSSPWPLSETLFLCSYSFEYRDSARTGYGLYLYDIHGNKELVYRDPSYSCYAPIPLRPRPEPAIIAPARLPADPNAPGRLFVRDVNVGLDGVRPGTVKWLRICEAYPKKRHTDPHRVDAGVGCGWDFRGVLGVVPVEKDGSAHFEIPPHKMIFMEALDKDFLEVRRMRNYINLQPGEMQACVGCHEPPGMAGPANMNPIAIRKPPAKIREPSWGAGPMQFWRVVQPILDSHCVQCHNGERKGLLDLRGGRKIIAPHTGDRDEGPQHRVSTSFLALLPYVRYLTFTGYWGPKLPLKPYATGSAVSPLMKFLKKGHGKIKPNSDEWRAFAAWIDCNAPYYGDYDEDFLSTRESKPVITGRARPFACADFHRGRVCLVDQGGTIRWEYPAPACTDVWVLKNGNLLFTTGRGVKEVTRKKKVVFSYTSKSEIFTCQRLANGNTFLTECDSASLVEVDPAGKVVKRIRLLPEGRRGGHDYIGAARKLENGNYLVAHYGNQVVIEYGPDGEIVRRIPAAGGPHGVVRLPNGNTLIACADRGRVPAPRVFEVDPAGRVVWEVRKDDLPGISLKYMTGLERLPNGNTLMTNWLGHSHFGEAPHIIEITPDKKVVWSFYDHKNMRSVTSVQALNSRGDPTRGEIFH